MITSKVPSLSRNEQKKYICTGNHKSFDYPTTKRKAWCCSTEMVDSGEEEDIPESKITEGTKSEKKKSGRGILVYLDTLFKEKEKTLKEA